MWPNSVEKELPPDSPHVAYCAKCGNHFCVVLGSKESKSYKDIGKGKLFFSPDSKHLSFIALTGSIAFINGNVRERACVVFAGRESKQYDMFLDYENLFFTDPNSLRSIMGLGLEFLRIEIELLVS